MSYQRDPIYWSNATRVQGNFITGSGTESGTGTVTDSVGNTYKLLF